MTGTPEEVPVPRKISSFGIIVAIILLLRGEESCVYSLRGGVS
jgi:hypothetical protein